MKHSWLILVSAITCLLLIGNHSFAQGRPRPSFDAVSNDASLPRILIIGDSISIGYTTPVRLELKGKASVHRIPTNGGPTTRGVRSIEKWLGDGRWDVIHFNWGLHDLKFIDAERQVPLDEYEKNLRTLVARLKKTNAILMWCSTTPVPEEVSPPRTNDDVLKYNEVAGNIMEESKIAINDLYAFAKPRLVDIQRPNDVHFSQLGSTVLGKEVAAQILKLLDESNEEQ